GGGALVRRVAAPGAAGCPARESHDWRGQRPRRGAPDLEARRLRAHPMARADLGGLAEARRLDPPRGPAASASRDHRRQARCEDSRGLRRRPGRGDPARPRRQVPGGVPDRGHDTRGAPGGRARRRALAAEIHTLLPEAAGWPRVPPAGRMSAGEAPPLRYTGMRIKRLEDPRLLAGRGRYLDDLGLPRMLVASFVRSPHAHARIVRIDASAARVLPGVIAVVTADDLSGVTKPLSPRLEGPGYT